MSSRRMPVTYFRPIGMCAAVLLFVLLAGRMLVGQDDVQRPRTKDAARPNEKASAAAAGGARWSVPDSAQQDQARAKLKERLRAEFAKARKPEAMAALAERLMKDVETAEDGTAAYALLSEAGALLARSGDLKLAFDTVAAGADKFDNAAVPLKSYAALAAASPTTREQAVDLHAKLTELAKEAGLAGKYDLAVEVSESLVTALKRPAFKGLRDDAVRNSKQVAAAAGAYRAASPAAEKLKADPMDRNASLTWGRFLCFYHQDWQAGLPLLAQSDDKTWAPIAARELNPPSKPVELLQFGDDWFKAGDKDKDPIRFLSRDKADAAWQLALQNAAGDADAIAQKVDQRFVKLFGASLAVTGGDAAGVSLPRTDRFVPAGEFTAEFWVSTQAKQGTLISKRHTQSDATMLCHIDNGKAGLSVAVGNGEGGSGGGPILSDGRWHHLALVKQQTQLTVYVDGQQAVKIDSSEELSSNSPWKLGTSFNRTPLAARFGGVRLSNNARYTGPFVPKKVFAKDGTTLFP